MDKIASQIKVLLLFGMVGGVSLSLRKNEVGIILTQVSDLEFKPFEHTL